MDNVAHAQKWIEWAQADLDVAQHLKTHYPVQIEIICFHCQQAAEKALKAILAYHDEEIPRTHDLVKILKLCEKFCSGITDIFVEQADYLSQYAVAPRYPAETRITKKAMDKAISYAGQILSHVKQLLPIGKTVP